MNDIYTRRDNFVTERKQSVLVLIGAIIAIISFFLPWMNYDLVGAGNGYSGSAIGGLNWVIFAAALVMLLTYLLTWPDPGSDSNHNAPQTIVVIAAFIGLGVMIFNYVRMANAEQGIVTSLQSIQFGMILTFAGFILSTIGALTKQREAVVRVNTMNIPNRLNEQPINFKKDDDKGL